MIAKSGCVGFVFREEGLFDGARSQAAAYVVLDHALEDDEGNIKVTAETHSMEELRLVIQSLKQDLDEIVEQAKPRFEKHAR